VEQNHGSKATAFIFFISSIGANVISATFMPEYVTVGASGGIFGLIGCCVSLFLMETHLSYSLI
jgi:membrane associated rhomboid family serine protease